jgi:hypothetical protein
MENCNSNTSEPSMAQLEEVSQKGAYSIPDEFFGIFD